MAEEEKKKGKRPTPLKRDMQNKKRCLQNRMAKSKLRTAVKKFTHSSLNQEERKHHLSYLHSLLDKAVKKNLFKKNKANRLKSKFALLCR